jgi:two-component system, OmpR family, alkaline phosphatase synthesis response regulator PhoP
MTGSKILILEENEAWNPTASGALRQTGGRTDASSLLNDSANIRDTGLIIDKAAYTVYLEGAKIAFPKKEFELLLLLASNPRKVFKRVEILQQIWGKDFKQKDSRSLDVHIRMLRKKLNDLFITTIRGVGYKLEK